MLGYYEDEKATNEVITDNWFDTGDLGYKDEDGFIYITGRAKNVIVLRNGKNIYPEELEEKILQNPLIEDGFVFGNPYIKSDDLVISTKLKVNEEVVKENYSDKSKEEIEEIIKGYIKEINNTIPEFKMIKKVYVTYDLFIKTSTNKIKRYQEIEKIKNEESK